ncbi:hypothetical protein FNH04_25800 [Streptomyces phyllanthi]|uniref:Uncharacterized protein n=1 Tax=Streptomyces phyllanthi TaxID=1803180 RepID=A0A5N8W6T7_9ACTN|nr:hypothetical protein [Streptomyces phyllanthi]
MSSLTPHGEDDGLRLRETSMPCTRHKSATPPAHARPRPSGDCNTTRPFARTSVRDLSARPSEESSP